jgi:putative ABC transport system permease protein
MWFITVILKNLARRRIRSGLTVLGIAVAVGTTVALLGLSDGFERSTLETFEGRGVDIVVMEDRVLDQLSSDLDEDVADRILMLPHVVKTAGGLIELVDLSQTTSVVSVIVQGWRPGSFLFEDLIVHDGRLLTESDRQAALLGMTAAQNLNKKVGDSIQLSGEEFEVVGIYESHSLYENGAAVVLLSRLQELMARPGRITGISVILTPGMSEEQIEEVCRSINAMVDKEGQPLELAARATREYVKDSLHIKTAHAMAWMTSLISVVVGAIGVLNTMFMAVAERTREISILRAIGWKRFRVVRMILGESLLLSLLGALVGMTGAVILTRWLTTLPVANGYISGDVAPVVVFEGFLMALLVGLFGGLGPALRATRLAPCEGLRHE